MLYVLIWGHFVADFILQSHAMASNKSSSNAWLGKHIAAYTVALLFILMWKYAIAGAWLYCLANGVAHFATDYVTSRMTKKLWAKNRVHDFFVVIGFDQAVHLTTLLVTMPLLRLP